LLTKLLKVNHRPLVSPLPSRILQKARPRAHRYNPSRLFSTEEAGEARLIPNCLPRLVC
ncbi:hypothetical protein V565_255440, partial [Rhizoctonia solani 123E]